MADTIAAAEEGLGPNTVERAMAAATDGEVFAAETFVATAQAVSLAWSTTAKRVLALRLDFTPSEGTPFTEAALLNTMQVASNLIHEMSYGKTWLEYTVTPEVFTLPIAASTADRGTIRDLALAAATDAGYTLSDYEVFIFTYQHAPHGGGLTSGAHVFLNGAQPASVLLHELGHVYGLGHAGSWRFSDAGFLGHRGLNERRDLAERSVYGDVFDLMGNDRYHDVFPAGHYSMHAKAILHWIEPGKVIEPTTSGRFRIYRFDHRDSWSAPGPLALKVRNREGEELWVGFRRNFIANGALSTGAYVIWVPGWAGGNWHCLLDMTPLSQRGMPYASDFEDAALTSGKTFIDPSGSVRLKTVGWGGTPPYEYLDVEVDFVSNQPAYELFTDASRTTPGLVGSYVNRSLRDRTVKDDWRTARDVTIAGTRVDTRLVFPDNGWGSRAAVGLTHGSDSNWDYFSVQWDGVLVVHRPIRVSTKSDDGCRMWIDLDGSGGFANTGREFLDNNWGSSQSLTLGEISETIQPGAYLIRIQYEEGAGDNAFFLMTSEVQFDVLPSASATSPGLTGSYVDACLSTYATQDDWRTSQTIVGTRTDLYPGYRVYTWGDLGALGITGATGDPENPYNTFSVQWDGWLRVYQPVILATFADDACRMWIDLNRDGIFDPSGIEFVDNNWGGMQGALLGPSSGLIAPGTYPFRMQYYDNMGPDFILLSGAPGNRTFIWIGAVDGYWGTGANWNTGTVPSDGANLVFPPGADRLVTTNNTSATHRFGSIMITSPGYVLRGNACTLSNGIYASYDTGTAQVELDLDLGADQTFACLHSGRSLTISGDVDLGSYTLSVEGEGTVNLGGSISGTGGLTHNGPGVLRLQGNGLNRYSGVTRVNAGRLILSKSAPPAIRFGELIIGDGVGGADADLVLLERSFQIGNIPITINSSGILDLNGYDDTVGPITLNSGHIETGGEFTIGTLTLGGDLTVHATGKAIIDGEIELPATRVFTVANSTASPDLDVRAVVTGSGGFTKNGAGAVGLYGANTFSGQVTINDGLVYAYSPSALGATVAGTVVPNGGVLAIANNTQLGPEPLTLSGFGDGISGALAATGGSNSCAGPITLNGDTVITVRPGCQLNLAGAITGSGNLIKRQTGTLIFSGSSANTFAGDALVEEGVLEMNKTVVNGAVAGVLRIGTDSGAVHSVVARNLRSSQCNAVVVNASGLYDLNDHNETVTDLTLNIGGDVQTGAGTLTLGSGSKVTVFHNPVVYIGTVSTISGHLNVGSGTRRFNVNHGMPPPYNPVDLEVTAVVSGSAAIIKEGAGIMSLTAPNTFTGELTISNGAVRVTQPTALGTASRGTTIDPGARLILAGSVNTIAEPLTFATGTGASALLEASGGSSTCSGAITLAGDATFHVSGATDALELSGVIAGPGDLEKTGDGTLTFSGAEANTYSGRTVVAAGVLELNKTAVNGSIVGELVIGDGTGGSRADVVRLLHGAQIDDTRVTVAASGFFDLNDWAESIGSLSGSGDVDVGSGILSIGVDETTTTFSGMLEGTGVLRKYEAGTFTLKADNPYSGMIDIYRGLLLVNGSQPASTVNVRSAGQLGGTGIVGDVTSLGTVTPGTSPGRLSSGDATLESGSSLTVELAGTTAGSDYDQLNVKGLLKLNNPTLNVSLDYAPAVGDEFIIVANDLTDEVTGQFQGLPDGAVFTVEGIDMQINYDGGSGNDVVLTVVGTSLEVAATSVTTGNGNGIIDPNECNLLYLVLTNTADTAISGIQAQLTSPTPGVLITQPDSVYPDISPGSLATNLIPFQISTLPTLAYGVDVELELALTTATHGSFVVRLTLPSGSPAAPLKFDTSPNLKIPDAGAVSSPLSVTHLGPPIADISVWLYITHPRPADLDIHLRAPDGTTVLLSSDNPSGATSKATYGSSCVPGFPTRSDGPTIFSDHAHVPITAGSPPFVGQYRPESPLAALTGKSMSGTWELKILDDAAGATGSLHCWGLVISPYTRGDGPCLPCPNMIVEGAITPDDLVLRQLLRLDGIKSKCGQAKTCPGFDEVPPRSACYYDVYTFQNGASNACVKVQLQALDSRGQLHSAAYLRRFDPNDPCRGYLADAGVAGSAVYAFEVPAREVFVVMVTDRSIPTASPAYRLTVSGGSCDVWLDIDRVSSDAVRLTWPTFAPAYQLESTGALPPGIRPLWLDQGPAPLVRDSQYTVTNTISDRPVRFYRLHKP